MADRRLSSAYIPLSHHAVECNGEIRISRKRQPTVLLLRFAGWFVGFSGLFAMGSVCPFCGKQGCPVGSVSAGFVGLLFASLAQWGKTGLRLFLHAAKKLKNRLL